MTSKQPDHLRVDRQATPVGEALIVTDGGGYLRAFDWADHEADMIRLLYRHYRSLVLEPDAAPSGIRARLRHYFDGDLGVLKEIEWHTGGTSFQRAVWTALTRIPPGTTLSYGALAAQLEYPSAVRAVGTANGSNPIIIVVPCHRVIGSNGSLMGYGGGIERKRWLLRHEGAAFSDAPVHGA